MCWWGCRQFFEMRYCARGISKIPWKPKFVFSFWTQSQNVPRTAFKIAKYVQKCYSLVVHDLTIFDPLVFPKIKLVIYTICFIMSKLFHFQLPNFLLKLEHCKNQKSSLGETKTIFHNFLRTLFWWNVR